MTVERSQEAVEAAEAAIRDLFDVDEDEQVSIADEARAALAAADAVDPCVPVRVLREALAGVQRSLLTIRSTAFPEHPKARVDWALDAFDEVRSMEYALAALLDEHANERTDPKHWPHEGDIR